MRGKPIPSKYSYEIYELRGNARILVLTAPNMMILYRYMKKRGFKYSIERNVFIKGKTVWIMV